jgi:hypothetical protein
MAPAAHHGTRWISLSSPAAPRLCPAHLRAIVVRRAPLPQPLQLKPSCAAPPHCGGCRRYTSCGEASPQPSSREPARHILLDVPLPRSPMLLPFPNCDGPPHLAPPPRGCPLSVCKTRELGLDLADLDDHSSTSSSVSRRGRRRGRSPSIGHTPRVLMQGRRKSRRRTPTRIPLYSY